MSKECVSSKKIENLVIFILRSGFIFHVFFLVISLLMIYEVISEKEGSISLSSLLNIISSLGVFATIWVYTKQKKESDIKSKKLIKIKEKSIKKLYKQELDKVIDIHDEFSSILDYLKNNKKKEYVIIYEFSSCYCINFIDENEETTTILVQKRSDKILNGILIGSTDISEVLYEDIFSCLNALINISHVMNAFFSMAVRMNKNKENINDKDMAICDKTFITQYFLGIGTDDTHSHLNIINSGDTLKDIANRYESS
ncbi:MULTISPECIES: hypothetical protein [Proteus]|uniref:hypothetical protein n=1 Tax=Proteus TaxID=583 RepID=UPI0013781D52|nr:hypothetical protein [Proteus sp. G2662]EJD6084420.1 hypothetical protein [Proteus mirabilis]NBM95145.1 hypothetical protein [Proteus sp. G2662]